MKGPPLPIHPSILPSIQRVHIFAIHRRTNCTESIDPSIPPSRFPFPRPPFARFDGVMGCGRGALQSSRAESPQSRQGEALSLQSVRLTDKKPSSPSKS